MDDTLRRAVLYSQLPGIKRDDAWVRFGVSRRQLTEARRHASGRPDRGLLVVDEDRWSLQADWP